MGVHEVGPVPGIVTDVLAHDVARGVHAALAGLEHLHRTADHVADGVDVGDRGLQLVVDQDLAAVAGLDAEHVDGVLRARDLAKPVEHEVGLDHLLAFRRLDAHARDVAVAVVLDGRNLRSFPDLAALLLHAVDDVAVGLAVADQLHDLGADHEDRAPAGGVEEAAILDRRLRPADDDGRLAGLVVELLHQRLVVIDAVQMAAGHVELLGIGAGAVNDVLGLELLAGHLDGVVVDQLGGRIENELQVELLLGLEVHDAVRPVAAGAEQIDQLLHVGDDAVHLREPVLAREGARQHQLGGDLGEQMMRHAGVVRARAAEERPAVDDQLAAAHGAHIGRAEPPAGAAADEDRVELPVIVLIDVVDDVGGVGRLQALLDIFVPLVDGQKFLVDVPQNLLVHDFSSPDPKRA